MNDMAFLLYALSGIMAMSLGWDGFKNRYLPIARPFTAQVYFMAIFVSLRVLELFAWDNGQLIGQVLLDFDFLLASLIYFALFASVLSVIPAALAWLPLTGENLLWLFLLGVLATLAQWALTAAYGHAPAGQLGAFTYASVIFAAVLGWWLWDERLSLLAIVGIGTIIAAGLLVMLEQARLPVARLVEDRA